MACLLVQDITAQKLGDVKNKYVYVGIPYTGFAELASFGKQRSMNWCWAACIQMVLNYHEIPVAQELIVQRTVGRLDDVPADPKMMFKALNGWEVDVHGVHVQVSSNTYSTSAKEITAFVTTNKPLIVGLRENGVGIGHAYVLIGMFYDTIPDGLGDVTYMPQSVLLINPWPKGESMVDLSWEEFMERLIVCFKVWVH
ncbi:MAG: hypothetical protein IPG10_01540 [Flavobacteriales bacterium]|nr:hypothetical protein [Flavobacteriales bacterium]MBK6753115.1 hypothetical protein [Flavobacteriales bacterium]MBK7269845.1 hypothetical protein [Flavobacteriales bacterium]MBK9076641.1 hypothetical protein [Flavobacteriales bacterium]MBK9538057.1 hypothetical protein [Flavobacteriales bacterium]